MQLLAALLFDLIAKLIGQCGCLGAFAAGIAEDMNMAETGFFDEVEAFLPFLFGFAGKADDNIGGDIKVGILLS